MAGKVSTVTADGTTRTARRAAATYRAIVDAAENVVLESGADALTLEAVADRADVAVQTIYNRVGGRSAVLIAVAERALQENRQYMDAAYAAPGSPIERILRAAEAYTRFAVERPDQFRLLASPPNEPDAFARVAGLVEEQNSKLAEALADGIADGSINPNLDPVLAATCPLGRDERRSGPELATGSPPRGRTHCRRPHRHMDHDREERSVHCRTVTIKSSGSVMHRQESLPRARLQP